MQFERLGPYKIGKRLGRGGMGAVFEGMNLQTREPAAVKVLSPHLADDEGFRERFELEIETLKKLRHPNIVRMYGFGEEGGYLYYAMELVKGHSVEEELQLGRRFTWREVTNIAVQLSLALKHAPHFCQGRTWLPLPKAASEDVDHFIELGIDHSGE